MKVDDILKVKGRNVSTATPDAAVIRVVERMRLERIGSFVVSDDGRRIHGQLPHRAQRLLGLSQVAERHVPVVEQGQLCGIVSIGDVVKSCLEDADLEIRVLRDAYLGHR